LKIIIDLNIFHSSRLYFSLHFFTLFFKNNDTIYVNLNEPKSATNSIQSQHQNNHQQQLENIDNYSTPTSPAKSEVRFYIKQD